MLFCTRINLLTISHTTTHFLTHSISLSSKQPQQNQIRLTPTSSSVQISITTIHPMRSVTSKTEKSTLSLRTRVVSQLDIRLQFLVYILTVAILNVVAALKYFQWTIIHFHISNVKQGRIIKNAVSLQEKRPTTHRGSVPLKPNQHVQIDGPIS